MKRSWFAALIVAVVGIVPALGYADDDADASRRSMQSARELYAAGNWDTAREAYAKALESAPDGSVLQAEASLELASLLWEQGEYVTAEKRARAAMERAKKLGLDQAVGRLLLTLGHIEASRGQLADAEATLKICVKASTEQRDDNFSALCNINLRFVRQLRGRSVPPEAQYRRDLKKLENSGQHVLVGTALAKSAELQEKAEDHAGALDTLRKAQAQFVSAGSVPAQSRNKLRLAQTLQNTGRWSDAAAELDGLVLTFRNMKNRPALVTAYALRGKQRAHEGKSNEALVDLKRARSTARELGSPQLVANSELALCEFHANSNDSSAAKRHCEAANEGFSRVGVPSLAARSSILLARLAQAKQEWLEARKYYLDALEILEKGVSPSARNEREVAVQRVNLCQVEMQLKSSGAHQRCRDAARALKGVEASDASYRGMVAATQYAIGVVAPSGREKQAIEALGEAASEWIDLKQNVQAAEALLRRGKLQLESSKSQRGARQTFDEAAKALGDPADGPQTELAVQIGIQQAQLEIDDREWDDAAQTLQTVIERARSVDDAYSAAWGYNGLANVELKRGNRDEAIAALTKGKPFAARAKDAELLELIEQNLSKLSDK